MPSANTLPQSLRVERERFYSSSKKRIGWAWCQSDTHKQGWVPLRKLSSPESDEAVHDQMPNEL